MSLEFTDEQLAAMAEAIEQRLRHSDGLIAHMPLYEALDELRREANRRCTFTPGDLFTHSMHLSRLARVAR